MTSFTSERSLSTVSSSVTLTRSPAASFACVLSTFVFKDSHRDRTGAMELLMAFDMSDDLMDPVGVLAESVRAAGE